MAKPSRDARFSAGSSTSYIIRHHAGREAAVGRCDERRRNGDTSENVVVIGVGAERGVGAALCRRSAGLGLPVFVAGRTPEKVERVASAIRSEGGRATAAPTEATSEQALIELFRRAEAAGPVDLAIYNAGNDMPGVLLTMEADFFERCWRAGMVPGDRRAHPPGADLMRRVRYPHEPSAPLPALRGPGA